MSLPPNITLIISTYEQPSVLPKVLAGVARQSRSPVEVLVADDGSGPATRDLVENWENRLGAPLYHHWHQNRGFRKTLILNKAIAAAKGEYIVFLDGDCVPHQRFIEDHSALAEPSWWVQGRRCFVREQFVPEFESGSTSVLGWCLRGRISSKAKALRLPAPTVLRNDGDRGILGCNMGIWHEDLEAINGFDESFKGWGHEDSELGHRLYHLGRLRKFVYGQAVVFHLNHSEVSRDEATTNLQRLRATTASGRVRCEKGLDQHLANGHNHPAD